MAFSSSTKRKREMEENAFLGMAPAPASPTPTTDDSSFQRYDVFINHRGPDVKNSLASVLCEFLQYLGLKVFLDLTELLLGDSLSTNIQRAIRNCLVHIAIFSKGYAESPWCLAELSLMLKTGAKIVPLFYGVAPSDLRYVEKGPYAAAFATYLAKGRHLNRLDEWKQALHQASFITGIEFNPSDGNMGSLCKNIVDTVFNEVREAKNKSKLEVAEHPVGLEETIQELEAKISSCAEINNGNGKIVGVMGRSGVGKTTLAKEFYNRKHTTFCRSSFLFNVGKADADKKMGKLRHKLLRDISMPLPLSTGGKDGFGVERIRSELERWYSKPLIILDGVDNVDQLEALAVNEFLNHGALIIVTCRDASVLQSFEMVKIYEMRGLDPKYARRLFCWHAFRRSHPPNGREKLVEDILKVSGGLPSNLMNLGQDIYTMLNDIDAEV